MQDSVWFLKENKKNHGSTAKKNGGMRMILETYIEKYLKISCETGEFWHFCQ